MKYFKIRRWMLYILSISFILISSFILINITNLQKVNNNITSIFQDRVIPLRQLKVISDNYVITIENCTKKVNKGDITWESAIPIIEDSNQKIFDNWKAYLNTYLSHEERAKVLETSALLDSANQLCMHLVNVLKSGKDPETIKILEQIINSELNHNIDPVIIKINELIDIQINEAYKLKNASMSLNRKIAILSFLFGLFMFLFIMLLIDKIKITKELEIRSKELEDTNKELNFANEELFTTNEELNSINTELINLKNNLENLVKKRTKELSELSVVFEETIQTTSDGIWFMDVTPDKKFKITRVNPVIENTLKIYNKDLGAGKLIEELFKPLEAEYFNGRYSVCLNSGQTSNYEELIELNNEKSYWNTTLVPVKNESGETIKIVGFKRNQTKVKQIEETLRESSEKYRLLFEKMMNAFVIYEPVFDDRSEVFDFRYLEMNPAFDKHATHDAAYCTGKTFGEVHDFVTSVTLEKYIEVFKTGVAMHFNTYNPMINRFYDIYAFKPNENRIAAIFQDITSAKITELEKEHINEYLQTIIDASPLAIFDLNKKGNVNSIWNKAAERIFGWNKDEVLGNPLPFITDSLQQEFSELRERVLKGEIISNIELKRSRKDGQEIYINLGAAPINTLLGKGDNIIAVISDITEKKKLEQVLIDSENKFRKLFENSTEGIAIYDFNFNIIEANEAALKIIGYTRKEYLSLNAFNLLPEKYHAIIKQRQVDRIKGLTIPDLEVEIIHKNGSLVPVEMNSRIIELNGQPLLLTIIRDLSFQKEFQKKLIIAMIEAEEGERRKLAGNLHDDIGPQLASMRMYASSLLRRNTDDKNRVILDILMNLISKSIESIRDISYDLSPGVLERYGLAVAINSECDLIRLLMPVSFEHNIKKVRFPNKIETIFYRIVKELLNNTKKYANATNAEIKITHLNNLLTLEYQDNGNGFDYPKIRDLDSLTLKCVVNR